MDIFKDFHDVYICIEYRFLYIHERSCVYKEG